jgi:hypothetical protein
MNWTLEVPPILLIILIAGLALLAGYSIGYKEGHGDGYLRGRSIARALKDAEASR